MNYRHNEDGSWTYICERCGKQEHVKKDGKAKRIRPFSHWVAKFPQELDYVKLRLGLWLESMGGIGVCGKCGKQLVEFYSHQKHPKEDTL